ncbi:MAG: SBBP repeat-containing protein, partial [Candidatus Binataceae bacterium]
MFANRAWAKFLPRFLVLCGAAMLVLTIVFGRAAAPVGPAPHTAGAIARDYGRVPLSFEPNVGQAFKGVDYLARTAAYTMYIDASGASFDLRGARAHDQHRTVHISLAGANPRAVAAPADKQAAVSNYYIGNDRSKWREQVPSYAKVGYRESWPHIDVLYHGTRGQLEFDLLAAPGADPARAAFNLSGVDRVELDSAGDALLHVAKVALVLHKPEAWQNIGGTRRPVDVRYRMSGPRRLALEVGAYDSAQQLIIDPEITYSTFIGGDVAEGTAVAIDSHGFAYLTGWANDNCEACAGGTTKQFPITTGPTAQATATNDGDAWVEVINPSGSRVYSTIIGGSGFDEGTGLAPDFSSTLSTPGNLFVTGYTDSSDFPGTKPAGATLGNGDAWVAEFSPTGARNFVSIFGGDLFDQSVAIAVEPGCKGAGGTPACNPIIAGVTLSKDFDGGSNTLVGSSLENGFLLSVDSTGGVNAFQTYGGAASTDPEYLTGVAIDSSGAIYVVGNTNNSDFPNDTDGTLTGSFSGTQDAFAMKLPTLPTSSFPSASWATYIGGKGYEEGLAIALNPGCNSDCTPYVSGTTFSPDFPTAGGSPGAYAGTSDIFVVELAAAGTTSIYSTLIGGSPGSTLGALHGISVDTAGDAFIVGTTNASDLPNAGNVIGHFQSPNGGVYSTTDDWTDSITSNSSQWPAGDPKAGTVVSFQNNNSGDVFAATDRGGIWSSNDGVTFTQLAATGLPSDSINYMNLDTGIPGDADVLFVATAHHGLYISANGGVSFTASGIGSGNATWVADLAGTSLAKTKVFTAVVGTGVEGSSDGGTTFSAVGNFPSSIEVFDVASSSGAAEVYFATNQGVWKASLTDVSSLSFTAEQTGLASIAALSAQADKGATSKDVYIGAFEKGLYVSTDGNTFAPVTIDKLVPSVRAIGKDGSTTPNTIFAGVTSIL